MLTKLRFIIIWYYNCMYITNFVYNVHMYMYVKFACTRTLLVHASYYIKLHMHCMYICMHCISTHVHVHVHVH